MNVLLPRFSIVLSYISLFLWSGREEAKDGWKAKMQHINIAMIMIDDDRLIFARNKT